MLKIREHLTYSNVAATIALVVALGTGGAYAAGEIGSGEIENDSIRSKDLRDRKAVKAQDVKRDGLTGQVVKEQSLDADKFAPLASDSSGMCNPIDSTFVNCARASLTLPGSGRLLVIATGDYFSEGAPAALDCRVSIDGVNRPGFVMPGEQVDATSPFATDGFARSLVSQRLSRGGHTVALRCAEAGSADGRLGTATLSVLGISGG